MKGASERYWVKTKQNKKPNQCHCVWIGHKKDTNLGLKRGSPVKSFT